MLLEVQHVRKEFQNRTLALTDASFSVSQGDFVSVIGPSGAGKTTLFRILNGSLRCDGGAILVNGIHFESADRRTRRAIQTTIGTIYQDFALVENATCRQNVLNASLPDMAFLPAVCGFFGKARVAEADALLERDAARGGVHTDGTYRTRRLLYVDKTDYGGRPMSGKILNLDGREYRVVQADEAAGVLTIEIEAIRT